MNDTGYERSLHAPRSTEQNKRQKKGDHACIQLPSPLALKPRTTIATSLTAHLCLFDENAPSTSEIIRSTVDHRRCHHGASSVSSTFADVIVKSLVRSSHPNPVRFGPCLSDSLSLDAMRRAKPACSSRLHAAELQASRPSTSARVLQLMLPTRCGRGHDRSVVLIGKEEKQG